MARPSGAAAVLLPLILGATGCFPRSLEIVRAPDAGQEPAVVVAHWTEGDRFAWVLERFVPSRPNTRVRALVIPKDRYVIELTMLMLAGSGPDVFALPEESIAAYVANGWLLAVDPGLRERAGDLTSLPIDQSARPLEALTPYYFPHAVETSRLLYSRGAFSESGIDPDSPPRTIAELLSSARQMGRLTGRVARAYAFPLAEGIDTFREVLEPSALRSGRYHFRPDSPAYDLSIYAPWLRLLCLMEQESLLLPGWKTLTKRGALENFLRGNVAMLVATSADYAYLDANRPASLDIGVAPVPALETPSAAGAVRAGYGFVVNASSGSRSECMRLWDHLYSRETQEYLMEFGVSIPASARSWRSSEAPATRLFSFEAFLPSAGELLRFSPQSLTDSPVLLEAYRAALETAPERIPQILRAASDASRRRLLPRWSAPTF